jgi:hypothetical protein
MIMQINGRHAHSTQQFPTLLKKAKFTECVYRKSSFWERNKSALLKKNKSMRN